MNVMIVDDALIMRVMLKDILTAGGFTVVAEAGDPETAVTVFREVLPDMLCLDLTLDDSDPPAGLSVLAQVKEIKPEVQVVVISALDQVSITDTAVRRGAAAYINKPFDRDEIVRTLKNVAGNEYGGRDV